MRLHRIEEDRLNGTLMEGYLCHILSARGTRLVTSAGNYFERVARVWRSNVRCAACSLQDVSFRCHALKMMEYNDLDASRRTRIIKSLGCCWSGQDCDDDRLKTSYSHVHLIAFLQKAFTESVTLS